MNKKSIVMQVHIPDYDVQGGLVFDDKIQMVDFVLKYTKYNNPDANIYLSGHGHRPTEQVIADTCEDIYWEDECRQINSVGFLVDNPAQYTFVYRGLQMINGDDDTHVLRTRGDSISCVPNVLDFCSNMLDNKKFIITQQTDLTPYKMGDFFHYGRLQDLKTLWNSNIPPFANDGLVHIGKSYLMNFVPEAHMPHDWHWALRKHCNHIDLFKLKFMDLRWNYHKICKKYGWKKFEELMFDDQIDFREFLWGNIDQWPLPQQILFDEKGNLLDKGLGHIIYSDQKFYED